MAVKTYLFQPDGKGLKQGFLLKDENGAVVYEARMLKQSLIGPATFEFANRLTGASAQHKVGKTATTESQTNGFTNLFSTKSRFKFDGENIWDHLHGLGIRIDSRLSGGKLGMTYSVTLKGRPLCTLASTTPKGKSLFSNAYFYDLTAEEADLDLAFLTAFAIARTDQVFYS